MKIDIDTSVIGGYFDKEFDCIELKNKIQTTLYKTIKSLNFAEQKILTEQVINKKIIHF